MNSGNTQAVVMNLTLQYRNNGIWENPDGGSGAGLFPAAGAANTVDLSGYLSRLARTYGAILEVSHA